MGIYERYLLPRLINWVCGQEIVQQQRQRVVPGARGRVLEIGIGPGHNLGYYDAARVESVIGIDPSAPLLAMAKARIGRLPFPVELLTQGGEELPLPDESVDTVVVTFTLCTIPAVDQALAQMRRVLKPAGRLIFCEHGCAPDASVRRWQERVNPLWRRCFGGCNLNRDMPALIRAAGFRIEMLESGYLEHTPRIAGYRYLGMAGVG